MPKLYIIAGCNGAGKTTASYTVLPEMLGCKVGMPGVRQCRRNSKRTVAVQSRKRGNRSRAADVATYG